MGVNQSTVQNQKTIMKGSGKIEASFDNEASWQNLGLSNDINATSEVTPLDADVQNGVKPDILEGVAEETGTAAFSLFERDLQTLTNLSGGINKYTSVAGAPVVDAAQQILSGNWSYLKPFELNILSASIPSSVSVVGSVNAILVEGVDFMVVQGQNSYRWNVFMIAGGALATLDQDLDLEIDYTTIASEKLTSGGASRQATVAIRLTNKTDDIADANDIAVLGAGAVGDSIYRVTVITYHKGTQTNGNAVDFKSKDDTDPAVLIPIEMAFKQDDTRAVKEKLYAIDKYIELVA